VVGMSLEEHTPELRRKVRDAAWLTRLSGGRLKVTYDPEGVLYPEDEDGEKGHHCRFDVDLDDDSSLGQPEMYLDDRAGPLGDQLVKELRRVGRLYLVYLALANQMESAIAKRTPLATFEDQAYAVVIVRRPKGWKPHRFRPDEDDLDESDNDGRRELDHADLEDIERLALLEINKRREDALDIVTYGHEFKRTNYWMVALPMDEVALLPTWTEYAAENGIKLDRWGREPIKRRK
jgi:hypothetical protein